MQYAEIEKLRTKIRRLKDEIVALAENRCTREEAAERLTAWVDQQADSVAASTLVSSATRGSGRLDDEAFRLYSSGSRETMDAAGQLAPFLCWMMPEQMKNRLLSDLDEHADQWCAKKAGKDRRAELTKKRGQLHDAEVAEERAICDAEAAGYDVPRRPDADPEIILAKEATADA